MTVFKAPAPIEPLPKPLMVVKSQIGILAVLVLAACSGGEATPGVPTGGSGGAAGSGTVAGAPGTAGTPAGGSGTMPGTAGATFGGMASGGAAGAPSAGGNGGTPQGGSPGTGGMPTGGFGGTPPVPPLDCGKEGWAVENHGSPKNRVNYVILADGYTAQTVETTLKSHIDVAFKRRFEHETGEPYGRYRKFVNICVMKAISQTDGIGKGSTAFDGGNGGDRLAAVNSSKVNTYINANVPKSFEIDWRAVVLNQNRWENTGSILMLWSGAHGDAAGAALHEGGHGFHQLADEYCGKATGAGCGPNMCGGSGTEHSEVNSTGDCTTTGNKWNLWLGTTQKALKTPDGTATGLQGTFAGSRYVDSGQYRPSSNSMMNSLFGTNPNTSFNSVSREQMIFSIWRAVVPIDSTEPPAGAVMNPTTLTVNVIDPAVIDVDWSVDGMVVAAKGGPRFDVATRNLSSGTHMISAKAYDNANEDLVKLKTGMCPPSVRNNYCHGTSWPRSTQTVTWTVTIP